MIFSRKQRELVLWWRDTGMDGVIAEGAIRSGKTYAAVHGFLLWSQKSFSRRNFILAGKTSATLTRNVISPMLQLLEEMGWPYYINRGLGYLRIGSCTYWMFGASNEQSQDTLQGMTAAGCLADEAALFPRSFVDQMIARCSVEGSKLWFTCNPSYPAHFFKREFIDDAETKHLLHMKFTMDDNPALTDDIRQRYERMYEGVFYDRYIRGLWVVAEGLVYPMFDKQTMTSDISVVPGELHYLSIDYGITNPFVCLAWVIRRGVAYCVDEWAHDSRSSGDRLTDDELYAHIREWVGKRQIDSVVIDPSATSFIELVNRKDDWPCYGANNAVIDGITNTQSAMSTGCLRIAEGCHTLLRELGLYRWSESGPRDSVIKEDDHACDAMRYFIQTVGITRLNTFSDQ